MVCDFQSEGMGLSKLRCLQIIEQQEKEEEKLNFYLPLLVPQE